METHVLDGVLADILVRSLVIQGRVRLVQLPISSLVTASDALSNLSVALTYPLVVLAQKVLIYLVDHHVMHHWSVVAIDAREFVIQVNAMHVLWWSLSSVTVGRKKRSLDVD